ncbi:hypothetical protein CYLTODRAFT_142707 [Cylindrobasidium torrendii FP15055 ss-10]|uniref:Uncharacterized protein n=1 Tax=Cylindrobasidium torrendii FP15055 ss-10 TaxID=1314674 RepID=A0A0D7B1A8_9AGAR|nr:hypothetical protein CYLTODRAFT_142707 [Cylindrobasidium torrendii FP15055 ss-10]
MELQYNRTISVMACNTSHSRSKKKDNSLLLHLSKRILTGGASRRRVVVPIKGAYIDADIVKSNSVCKRSVSRFKGMGRGKGGNGY